MFGVHIEHRNAFIVCINLAVLTFQFPILFFFDKKRNLVREEKENIQEGDMIFS
jgi:hypothetical protein